MKSLTKAEIAEKIYDELHLTKRESKEIVKIFFESISKCLTDNEQIKLSGFGNFDIRSKKQRPGRNPKTGKSIAISARCVVTFRPGQKLKNRIAENFFTLSTRKNNKSLSYTCE